MSKLSCASMMLVMCLLTPCSKPARAAAVVNSDSLFVNYGLAANVTIPVVEPANEGGAETIPDVQVTNNPNQFALLNPGFVVFNEPDKTTVSDILVSYTGSSLQLYSDGAPNFPTIQSLLNFPLKQLGSFNEGANGITQNVGDLFGINANQITVTSDGDAPEPGTYGPVAICMLLLLAVGRSIQSRENG